MVSKAWVLLSGLTIISHLAAAKRHTADVNDFKGNGQQTIIGGEEIEPGSRPYLAAIGVGESAYFGQYCGASLIASGSNMTAVMTSAHCLFIGSPRNPIWAPPEWVEFNRHDFFNETGVKRVYLKNRIQCDGDAVYHPGYDQKTFDNDVAILFLDEPVKDITPITLNTDPKVPVDSAPLDVSGWGLTEDGFPSTPYAVTVDYVNNEACTKKPYRYKEGNIAATMMCAAKEDKDSCYGDSGGPLVLGKQGHNSGPQNPAVQVGIVSWGKDCADRRFPGVYTRVSSVADFVTETVCERTGELCDMNSKSGKQSKGGKSGKGSIRRLDSKTGKTGKTQNPDTCVKVSTFAPTTYEPTTTTFSPTISPTTTRMPVIPTPWPTWSPTTFTNEPTTSPAPSTLYPSFPPTISQRPMAPYTLFPTYPPTLPWPTWMPTTEYEEPNSKAGKSASGKSGKKLL